MVFQNRVKKSPLKKNIERFAKKRVVSILVSVGICELRDICELHSIKLLFLSIETTVIDNAELIFTHTSVTADCFRYCNRPYLRKSKYLFISSIKLALFISLIKILEENKINTSKYLLSRNINKSRMSVLNCSK